MMIDEDEKLYTFDQLDDRAKERARDWYCQDYPDYDWWDSVYEDFVRVCEHLNIELRTRPVKLMDGKTRQEPDISFSGFWSQGDGAAFNGTWHDAEGIVAAIKDYAPQDKDLHDIAERLWRGQEMCDHNAYAKCEDRRGVIQCVYVEEDDSDGCPVREDAEEMIADALKDLAGWLYKRLEEEYEYLTSDEVVDDNILANGYTFDEDGRRQD